jgi:hypothetical protein
MIGPEKIICTAGARKARYNRIGPMCYKLKFRLKKHNLPSRVAFDSLAGCWSDRQTLQQLQPSIIRCASGH